MIKVKKEVINDLSSLYQFGDKYIKNLIEKFYTGELISGIFTCSNENGENLIIDIQKNRLKISTYRSNNLIREYIYYKESYIKYI